MQSSCCDAEEWLDLEALTRSQKLVVMLVLFLVSRIHPASSRARPRQTTLARRWALLITYPHIPEIIFLHYC